MFITTDAEKLRNEVVGTVTCTVINSWDENELSCGEFVDTTGLRIPSKQA